jgi:hypothetical protein
VCVSFVSDSLDFHLQIIIASFYYVGALNEALGHCNRAARFLSTASDISSKTVHDDALVLARRSAVEEHRSSRLRESVARDSLNSTRQCVAEFSQVSVRNPFKVTLVQDLTMQVNSHCATIGNRCNRQAFCPHSPLF